MSGGLAAATWALLVLGCWGEAEVTQHRDIYGVASRGEEEEDPVFTCICILELETKVREDFTITEKA